MYNNGVLIVNLGSPAAPNPRDVRRYLKEFLNDPRVIDLPAITRSILVRLILLTRPKKTAAAYRKIWTQQGSPLLIHSHAFADALSTQLGPQTPVALGMRYGKPSIQSALTQLTHCRHIIVLPLFPQYSSAASGSAISKTLELIAAQWSIPAVSVIDHFYNNNSYIDAYADIIKNNMQDPDTHVLFSYHGLPTRHLDKSHCKAPCTRAATCPRIATDNHYCYRAQCYATSQLLATKLGCHPDMHSTSFQSRLGRTPWIQPYTDHVLPSLFKQGITKLAVACPAFVADNLETLEEIGIRAREQWQQLGGEKFTLIPCLNDNATWVQSVMQLIQHHLK